jgi:hypothetical protein
LVQIVLNVVVFFPQVEYELFLPGVAAARTTATAVRRGRNGEPLALGPKRPQLKPVEHRAFWIEWDDGRLTLGKVWRLLVLGWPSL